MAGAPRSIIKSQVQRTRWESVGFARISSPEKGNRRAQIFVGVTAAEKDLMERILVVERKILPMLSCIYLYA